MIGSCDISSRINSAQIPLNIRKLQVCRVIYRKRFRNQFSSNLSWQVNACSKWGVFDDKLVTKKKFVVNWKEKTKFFCTRIV